ncbi:MAG TPA: PilZ domain-containing protein [Gaiellales bacterium]
MDAPASQALASLPGRRGVPATSQDGAQIACDPFQLDGELLRAYLPRLQMAGIDRLTLRFAVGNAPWRAEFELTEAEYHSFEQAIGVLRLVAIEPDGAGRQSARVELRAPGVLTAIFCANAVDGNEYDVRIEDISETGVQLSTELRVEPGDEFAVTTELEGRRVRLEAKAVKGSAGAYGRTTVGARITKVSDSDLLAIRRLAVRGS